ncbi:MAG: hypothetical protein ABIK44_00730 [candidate division WOR-3 bacterium]
MSRRIPEHDVEFETVRRVRGRWSGTGLLILLIVVLALAVWYLYKRRPDLFRLRRAPVQQTEEMPQGPRIFVRGIDYDVPQEEPGDH